jgi:hypothetical protein
MCLVFYPLDGRQSGGILNLGKRSKYNQKKAMDMLDGRLSILGNIDFTSKKEYNARYATST